MPVTVSGISCTLAGGIRETTQTTSTGTYQVDGAATVDGITYRTFASVLNGLNTVYTVRLGSQFETAIGLVTSGAPSTISRTQILESSSGGAAVNWGAGTKDIFCDQAAGVAHSLQSSIDAIRTQHFGRFDASTLPRDVTIPANARWIDVGFSNLIFSGDGSLLVQIGTGGAPTATGYVGYSGSMSSTPTVNIFATGLGFPVRMGDANRPVYGMMRLINMGSNMWAQMHSAAYEYLQSVVINGGGALQLSGSCDYLRIAAVGGQTSDGWVSVTVGF
jgi:hypothetical protein